MLFPLVVLAAAVDRRRDDPAARRHVDPRRARPPLGALARAGRRVRRGATSTAPGPTSNKTFLMLIATVAAVAGIVAAWLVYEKARLKAREPAILANAWYYDKAVTDFMGGPGEAAFEAAAWFDANVVDGAVDGTGRGGARRRPASCARARPATCAPTPGSSASAWWCCSAGSSSSGGSSSGRPRLPDPHRRSCCRRSPARSRSPSPASVGRSWSSSSACSPASSPAH